MLGRKANTIRRATLALTLLVSVAASLAVLSLAQTVPLGEAVDNTSLTWTTGGAAQWVGQMDVSIYNGDAAQSGEVEFLEHSWLQTEVVGPGMLSFYWRLDEDPGRGKLYFYVDGETKASCSAFNEWEQILGPILSGSHTLKWDYYHTYAHTPPPGYVDWVQFDTEPQIIVLWPNGGESLHHRTPQAIQWAGHEDLGPSVRIDLYKGDDQILTLAASAAIDRSFQWFVPPMLNPGNDYRIKVTSNSQPTVSDFSDYTFEIVESAPTFRGALLLDGIDDYAESGDHHELDVGDEAGESFTIEALVLPNPFGFGRLIKKGDAYLLSTDKWEQWVYPPDGPPILYRYRCLIFSYLSHELRSCATQYGGGFHNSGWHHAAAVFDWNADETRLYLDGELLMTETLNASGTTNSALPLLIGEEYAGFIDEVRISDVARYSGEAYVVPTEPFTCDNHTRALWHFDEFENSGVFEDECGVENNVLIGYDEACVVGIPAQRVYLPIAITQ